MQLFQDFTPQAPAAWQSFQHPLVRQLAFCVASFNIIQQLPETLDIKYHFDLHNNIFWTEHFNHYQRRLVQLDQNPKQLEHFVAQLKSTRLGLRFEYLFWFWLLDRDYHAYELLGHSVQKIEGAKTLGELDFVLRNHETGKIEHWEVALKYYLGEADLQLANWYGLNRTDQLQRKLQHFTNKQFQFEEALDYPIEQRFAVLKGQLYIPIHTQSTLPNWINPAQALGLWGDQIYSNEFYRLTRHEWICPNATITSTPNMWWCDGLYQHVNLNIRYMYRQPSPFQQCPNRH